MARIGYVCCVIFVLLAGGSKAAERIRIVTTFLPAYCVAANVAGSRATVENLLPGSVSLHDYQLSPGDVRKLSSADLIVINGLGMETFLDKAFAASGPGTSQKIVQLSAGLESKLIPERSAPHHSEPGHEHTRNPHIWLDPQLFLQSVTNFLEVIKKKDPANAAEYRQNAAAYCARLTALDKAIESQLTPVRRVPFVTYHNAFPYFVRRYGLNLVGVVEQTPEVPPSARELSHLHSTIREQKVRALFAEPGATTRLARQIAADAKIPIAELDPLETGVLDAKTYERVMGKNADTLVKALAQ